MAPSTPRFPALARTALACVLALAALATPALAQTGICGRTAVVQTFILAEIEGVSACADVTGTHLAAITGSLLLNSESITALAAGDFAGLTSLTNLYLNNNELTALPAGVFAGLTALTELTLFDNVLIALPADVFEPLTSLTSLQLQRNDLATLPAGVFDALTALTDLQLHGNDLTTLPADVFEPLTALTEQLYLDDNPGAPFAPVAVALPDDGTVSSAGGTVRLDGSGSDGGPWGEYVTYSWALTNPSSGVTVTFDDAGSATPVVTIPALAANTELTFTLTVAGRSGSDGVTRGTDAARVTATTVPGAPTGLTATASGTTAINLSWSAPASTGGSAITGYKIESSSDGGSSWSDLVANTSNTTTTYAHTGLTAGDTRHYRVSAINTNGTGVPSNVANATTGATAPGAPTGLTATASGTTAINLSWSAPASTGGSAITGYNIEVSPNGTSGWTDQVANTGNANTTYAHTGLTAGTTRHYRVSAINANGTGVPSNVDSATTGTTVPGAPTGLTATASGTTAINLSWSAPASTGGSAITGYKIEVSPDGSSWSDLVADTGSTDTAYAHMGLDPATTRHYRVSTINAVGTSDASDSASTTTASTNTAATGAPTITGTAQVGQVLTATVGTIADVDGLPDPFFSDAATTIAWIRVATDNTETNIASATASTYTLGAADLGTTIKVRVSFTDDASNAETLTSAATAAVSAAANTLATGAPTITGTAQVGQTLTAGTTAIMDADGLTAVQAIGLYKFQWIRVATDNSETNIASATVTYTLVAADQGTTIKVTVSFTDDASNPETLTSAATAAVAAAPNTPATGAPTITGTATVGQTLTAGTTAIMDADGLTNVSYTYQWIWVDGGTETNISGATASTYTLVAADQGTTVKVTVSFTDDASNPETLTSAATAAVAAEVTGTPEPEPFEVEIVGVPEVAVTGESYELTVQSDEDSLVYAWRVDGGAIEPDDVQMVVWTAPETAGVAWIHVDVTREDGATAGQSAYVRVEVPEPEPEPVPALPLLGQLLLALGLAGAGAMRLVRSARRP